MQDGVAASGIATSEKTSKAALVMERTMRRMRRIEVHRRLKAEQEAGVLLEVGAGGERGDVCNDGCKGI